MKIKRPINCGLSVKRNKKARAIFAKALLQNEVPFNKHKSGSVESLGSQIEKSVASTKPQKRNVKVLYYVERRDSISTPTHIAELDQRLKKAISLRMEHKPSTVGTRLKRKTPDPLVHVIPNFSPSKVSPMRVEEDVYTCDEEKDYIERQASLFDEMKEELLNQYEGKYVLFEDNQVLDVGEDPVTLAMCAYRKDGMRPLFIEKVSAKPERLGAVWTPIPSNYQ